MYLNLLEKCISPLCGLKYFIYETILWLKKQLKVQFAIRTVLHIPLFLAKMVFGLEQNIFFMDLGKHVAHGSYSAPCGFPMEGSWDGL